MIVHDQYYIILITTDISKATGINFACWGFTKQTSYIQNRLKIIKKVTTGNFNAFPA